MLKHSHARIFILLMMVLIGTAFATRATMQSGAGFSANIPAAPLTVGQSSTVVIQVQTGGQAINGAEIHLDYNPAVIQINTITASTNLPLPLVGPAFSNTAGTVDYAAGTVSNFPTANFDLITIQFTALAAGSSPLRIPAAAVPRRSDITSGTSSVFSLTAPIDLGTITVAGAQPATSTPPPTNTPAPSPTPGGPGLKLALSPAEPVAGDLLTVSIIADQVIGLYGLETTCTVDPASVTGGALGAGDVFTSANSYVVDGGYQGSGSWTVAASLLNPAPTFDGTGTAYSLLFPLNAVSSFRIECRALAVNRSGQSLSTASLAASVSIGGPVVTPDPTIEPTAQPTIVPTIPPTATVTPEPTPTIQPTVEPIVGSIQGAVQYQRRTDQTGILLTVLAGGPNGTTFAQFATGPDGTFRFDNVPAGTYSIQFAGGGHLGAVYTFEVGSAGVVLNTVTLLAGDTDGNNQIDLADAALVGANLQQTVPPAPAAADLNADALINIIDLVLVGGNFGTSGPVVIGP
jgi:hypothetical protein